MDKKMRYSRFERARIIGARALQITLGAPVLMELPDEIIDPLIIATQEYENALIPITVRREMPKPL
jgi:DNA-directed RNA polymerase subunit K